MYSDFKRKTGGFLLAKKEQTRPIVPSRMKQMVYIYLSTWNITPPSHKMLSVGVTCLFAILEQEYFFWRIIFQKCEQTFSWKLKPYKKIIVRKTHLIIIIDHLNLGKIYLTLKMSQNVQYFNRIIFIHFILYIYYENTKYKHLFIENTFWIYLYSYYPLNKITN